MDWVRPGAVWQFGFVGHARRTLAERADDGSLTVDWDAIRWAAPHCENARRALAEGMA